MAAGPYTVLAGITLTAAEKQSGYTSNPTNGGPDVQGLLTTAMIELQAAQVKLAAIVGVIPVGANKTAINGVLTALSATS